MVQTGQGELGGKGHLEIVTATVTQRECSIFFPLERLTFAPLSASWVLLGLM